ncbi:YdcF family protein [Metabacillus litoralis]|uniref:YdcF family protein n=1 Tax=Metabacillus litoralis TaxID=152268 RepID=UPI001BA2972B|nr:YdcF family protein [Metabacillus litoralis]UHA58643.1 YdcF family protein [Metabacillus litoralis]
MGIKKLRLICLLIVLFISILIAYSAYTIWSFSQEDQLVHSDSAIVLGAAVWGDQPSPVFRERINHSISLYKNGYVKKVIFTGGKGSENDYTEAEVAKDYAIENGIEEKDILIETRSRITEENLIYAYDIALFNKLKTFTIVSDPLHMKRAIFIAKDIGMQAYSSPTPSTQYKSFKSQAPFLFREVFLYIGYICSSPFRNSHI